MAHQGFTRVLRDECGIAVWPLLIIVGVLVGLVIMSSQEIAGLSRLKAKERLNSDAQSLKTNIGMLFRNRTGCLANLSSSDSFRAGLSSGGGGWSANPNQNIRLYNPDGSGGAGDVFLEPGSAYDALTVESLKFADARAVSATGRGFLVELGVGVKQSDVTAVIRVPFYIVTDASNNMIDCFATQFSKLDPATNIELTLEDEICRGINGGNWHFDPADYRCVN